VKQEVIVYTLALGLLWVLLGLGLYVAVRG
jgi:hypothetical protein